jgi:uncharacterized Zn-binding protein involved in type VI secretion
MRTYLIPQASFIFILPFILFFSSGSLFSQDNVKLQELVDKLNKIVSEIENCGDDLDCINRKSKEMEKIAKEMEEAQTTTPKEEDTKIFNSDINMGEQSQLPPPFDSITDLWLEHMIASTPYTGKPADCEKINKTREELLGWISMIYEKEKYINGVNFPIKISYCNEASVITEEKGKIDVPNGMYLEYNINIEESPLWIVTSEIYLEDEYFRFGDKHNYRLSQSTYALSTIGNYSGWILDQRAYPPVKLPLNNVSLLSETGGNKVWDMGFSSESMTFTEILPSMYDLSGIATEYTLHLHNEPAKFYPTGKPEYYVESYSGAVFEKLSKEDILSAIKQGEYHAYFNVSEITNTVNTTKEITITFKPNKCDSVNSAGKGSIVLSGDCIDHGGRVIASNSSIYVNNKQVAFIGDEVICGQHGLTKIIASKNIDVLSGEKQIARIGDKTVCGATIIGGSKNTFAGIK